MSEEEGKDAKGQEGFLLIYPDFSTAVPTGIVSFRIYEYDEDGKHKRDENGGIIFKDYKISHHDLKIKLLDGKFYETEKGNYIDY